MGTPLVNPDQFPATLNRWLNVNALDALARTRTFVTLPAFGAVTVSWQGYSDIVAAYNYTSTHNFSLIKPHIPKTLNFLLCVSYVKSDNTVVRYRLNTNVNAVIYFDLPLYAGQPLLKNCRFEVWSAGANNPILSNDLVLKAGVLGLVDTRYGHDSELGTISALCEGQGVVLPTPATQPDQTDIAAWFSSALGITLNGGNVSAWADQVVGAYTLAQATAGNQPAYHGTANPKYVQFIGARNLARASGANTNNVQEVYISLLAPIVGANTNQVLSIADITSSIQIKNNVSGYLDVTISDGFTPTTVSSPAIPSTVKGVAIRIRNNFTPTLVEFYDVGRGILLASQTTATPAFSMALNTSTVILGDVAAVANGTDVFDLVVYSAPSIGVRQQTINYMVDRSGYQRWELPLTWGACAQPVLNS